MSEMDVDPYEQDEICELHWSHPEWSREQLHKEFNSQRRPEHIKSLERFNRECDAIFFMEANEDDANEGDAEDIDAGNLMAECFDSGSVAVGDVDADDNVAEHIEDDNLEEMEPVNDNNAVHTGTPVSNSRNGFINIWPITDNQKLLELYSTPFPSPRARGRVIRKDLGHRCESQKSVYRQYKRLNDQRGYSPEDQSVDRGRV